MALLPTGSDKLLEISTEKLNVVIKSKRSWQGDVSDQSSSLMVDGRNIKGIKVIAIEDDIECEDLDYAHYDFAIPPIFFEQTDYEIIIKSNDGSHLSFWNENSFIKDRVGSAYDGDDTLLSGVVNFENTAGYSDFEIYADGIRYLTIRIEVFPSKITYKEDYQKMIDDISEMVSEVALDFMQKTYQSFKLGDKQSSILSVYFQILSVIFNDYMNAVNRIISVPHHKLITEHEVVPYYKAKRTDKTSINWLRKRQDRIAINNGAVVAERLLTAKKQLTYDTEENRFVKYILKSTVRKLDEFIKRYTRYSKAVAGGMPEEKVIQDALRMKRDVKRVMHASFFNDVSEYHAAKSMSLVFGMAPGYRELYKCYLMLSRSLSVNGDVFKMSVKDTALLYEYWCFIKLFSMLKKEYKLVSPDIVKVDNNGITVTLIKGKRSEARFINTDTGEYITLVYNPSEQKTQTVNQRPDNVLELEKKGTSVAYKYVFDAKYRIEKDPSSPYYPDNRPGPKVDDINTMHRYRDSIVYENNESKFMFEKTMFGAYILFPYDDEKDYSEAETIDEKGNVLKGHRFYRSIDSVNIGGLPFLPGSTTLVRRLLDDLISDSKESAFERTTLPAGIEEKLAKVDWDKRDVLIGTFRSTEQFDTCFQRKFYYVPRSMVSDDRLPIHYVALYQTNNKFGDKGEIRYYGEAIRVALVRRSSITEVPISPGRTNGDELYYRITVREWNDITDTNESGKAIKPLEQGFAISFTNMFLLNHSESVPELSIKSEEEYRFYHELKRMTKDIDIADSADLGFKHGDTYFDFHNGEIMVIQKDKIVQKCSIDDFAKRPGSTFRLLSYALKGKVDGI
ncbi:restriction endonuclease-like protein [Butyrivibrio fibrisolvens]|uniref:restriction endonuclease-like protein n=1 Tax=Butyrivibrio fibrisolvens TaxID=831 RepID=UPI00040D3D22|nr:restriction endonuclease-like protein [Butyrivibrio fibrisolvens]